MSLLVPEHLETSRLHLRQFAAADLDAYAAIRSQANVIRYLPGGVERAPHGREVAAELLGRFDAQWKAHGFGPWAVDDKKSGRLIGHCGLLYVPQFDRVELLYLFDEPFWGRGLATEASDATLRVAFETLDLPQMIAMAATENLPSRRVLAKLGFVFCRGESYRGLDVAFYELGRDAWNQRKAAT